MKTGGNYLKKNKFLLGAPQSFNSLVSSRAVDKELEGGWGEVWNWGGWVGRERTNERKMVGWEEEGTSAYMIRICRVC